MPYEKVCIFHEALAQFIKARPREWIGLKMFRYVEVLVLCASQFLQELNTYLLSFHRAVNIQAELGFIEYMVFLQHRHSWQSYLAIKMSMGEVKSFCLELSKKLDMRYQSPALPVNISMNGGSVPQVPSSSTESFSAKVAQLSANSEELKKVAALFEPIP